ncbi:MAG: tetraacyldisaccharide 4'-kinase [Acidobacteriota bacterium]
MNTRASVLMMPLSTVYRALTEARLAAYRSGLFRTSTLPAPVISVGNITTGGTGKTPLVEWVCRTIARGNAGENGPPQDLISKKTICVLTRGYGKLNPKEQVLVSNSVEVLANEREAGDEPLLLARNLLGIAAVISNPDRVSAGEWAVRNLGTEVFVLDDGFQHLRIARDLDIVTIDATNPFGGGEMLPHGRLREPIRSLSRADCVVITRSDQAGDLDSVKGAVRPLVGTRPVFSSRMVPTEFRRLGGESVDGPEVLNQTLGAFCGVGNPASFFTQVRNAGLRIPFTRAFPDHYKYSQAGIDALVGEIQASGATGLITTAKDATRLSALKVGLPCYVLEIRISIDEEERLAGMILAAISHSPSNK